MCNCIVYEVCMCFHVWNQQLEMFKSNQFCNFPQEGSISLLFKLCISLIWQYELKYDLFTEVNLSPGAEVMNRYWPGKRWNTLNCILSYCITEKLCFGSPLKLTHNTTSHKEDEGLFSTQAYTLIHYLLLTCILIVSCFAVSIVASSFSFFFCSQPQLVWSLWGDCRGCQWITTSWSVLKVWGTYTHSSTWTAHTTTW